MRFEFATATKIIFGAGSLREAGPLAKTFAQRALVVTGQHPGRAEPLYSVLRKSGVEPIVFPGTGEPDIKTIEDGTELAWAEQCDLVIGFGGGSAIDTGKAIAAMLTNDGDLFDYLEVIGRGKPLEQAAAPFIAIPTTAGTGAEVTRNAVLASPEHCVKVSLRSPSMLPKIALVDPELTYDLPPAITANTGLDALTQLIEPYVCSRANPMTDAF
ncbi:MAG TPA: iron-containing alcohol dehydrogenase, partial [Candidatus Paceibacterota bacterium]|nr:iron-containing alcohol dehydrogenase [Candidatus Paceibacterota bacterium]